MNHPAKCLICLVHKPKGRIEHWRRFGNLTEDQYSIAGAIYGDIEKRWEDGHSIFTSLVKEIDAQGHCWTRNSLYILGEPGEGEEYKEEIKKV